MRFLHRRAQTIPERKRAAYESFTATLQGPEESGRHWQRVRSTSARHVKAKNLGRKRSFCAHTSICLYNS
jgi:hypothetical protein